MTGAMALAALTGLASLLAGVALGWHLRTNDRCSLCGKQLSCETCVRNADRPRPRITENAQ